MTPVDVIGSEINSKVVVRDSIFMLLTKHNLTSPLLKSVSVDSRIKQIDLKKCVCVCVCVCVCHVFACCLGPRREAVDTQSTINSIQFNHTLVLLTVFSFDIPKI